LERVREELERESRLAAAARTRQRHEARRTRELAQGRKLALAADEVRQLDGQRALRRPGTRLCHELLQVEEIHLQSHAACVRNQPVCPGTACVSTKRSPEPSSHSAIQATSPARTTV